MKLFLTSYRVPHRDKLEQLLTRPLAGVKIAVIPNAKDYYAPRARTFKVGQTMTLFEDLGARVTLVDLRDFQTSDELVSALTGNALIWAVGGNTFCLRYEMKRSGFDSAIVRLLSEGVVYGGESAGAIVAGTSLRGVESADEPAFAEAVIWEGMGLIERCIIPHVGNPTMAAEIEQAIAAHAGDPTLLTLTDEQALVCDDTVITVI